MPNKMRCALALVVRLALLLAALTWLAPAAAFAAEPVPGDSCTPNGTFTRSGGPETSGVGNLMVCSGGTWATTFGFDATANGTLPKALSLSGDITPTALAANTDNWAPTGLATASVIRASASGAFNLTGLTGGADGRVLTIFNIGANSITLKNQSTSSTAANRFAINADLTLGPEQGASLMYDASSQRWRSALLPFSGGGGGLSGPAGCTSIGDLCADGTVFAGWNPITQEQLFIPLTDQGTTSKWKTATGTNDIATDSIYDGRANSNQVPNSATFPAFKLCKDLTIGGHSDWYLPSQAELYYVRAVKDTIQAAGNITNFQNADYWSSSELSSDTINAWTQTFASGTDTGQQVSSKTGAWRVRCIRR